MLPSLPRFLRPSSRRLTPLLLLFSFILSLLYLLDATSHPVEVDVIVSIYSSLARLDLELPLTIQSILHQTVLPKEIRVYLPLEEEGEIRKKLR